MHEEEHSSHLPFFHVHRASGNYAEDMLLKSRVSLFSHLLMLLKQRDLSSLQYILFFYLLTSVSISVSLCRMSENLIKVSAKHISKPWMKVRNIVGLDKG